jgi:hypothetical protein
VLIVGGVLALRLPEHVDEAPDRESPPPPRFVLSRSTRAVTDPLAAAAALRALAGLLTLFLAFLLREDGAPGLLVGLVVGAAALGQLSGTALAARLPEGYARPLSAIALGGPFVACLGAAVLGSDAWVVATAAATGVSVSLSRFALDAALQEHVTSRSLGSAFARSETALQLAWVLGAFVAVCLPTTAALGLRRGRRAARRSAAAGTAAAAHRRAAGPAALPPPAAGAQDVDARRPRTRGVRGRRGAEGYGPQRREREVQVQQHRRVDDRHLPDRAGAVRVDRRAGAQERRDLRLALQRRRVVELQQEAVRVRSSGCALSLR